MSHSVKKKMLYRSKNRGSKENDLLVGGFVEKYLEQLDEKSDYEKLCLLGDFLSESDPSIFDWIIGKKTVPDKYCEFIEQIQKTKINFSSSR